MPFSDINISNTYETGYGDPVNDFYVPVLSRAVKYDRIAGYFSSASLAIAARGIAGLIANGGKMRIIASPYMSNEDIDVINHSIEEQQKEIENEFINNIDQLEDKFQKYHLKALGWMLSKGLLEIKIAYVTKKDVMSNSRGGLFHQKIGILEDLYSNQISFSGSINETASGWLNNIEEFKVFKEWEIGQKTYLLDDIKKFDDFWNNNRDNVKVVEITKAAKDKLISISKDFDNEKFITKKYIKKSNNNLIESKLSLFFYQKDALTKWIENSYSMLFEMATGTGKTRTAIACIYEVMKRNSEFIAIVSCPQSTLSRQWKKEIERKVGLPFDASIIADSSNSKWKENLKVSLKKILVQYHHKIIIYTTHKTGCSKQFIKILNDNAENIPICFVGDEAHGLGSNLQKKGLLDIYKYRIGLSATPRRWFDDIGTNILTNYFGKESFEFTILDAQSTINPITNKTFLVNYYYHPIFIKLSDDELDEYLKLSNRVKRLFLLKDKKDEYQKSYENLLNARAAIVKNCINKYIELEIIIKDNSLKDTIIFTSDKQIDKVLHILSLYKIRAHKYTKDEKTAPEARYGGKSQREHIISSFVTGDYQALVAIKCLDEGIDIPSASTAILMANSSNPREYIQRIGRVIRQDDGKSTANIYDFIVEPSIDRITIPEMLELEKNIFEKEMCRVKEMSSNAINNTNVLKDVYKIKRRFLNGY